MYHISHHFVIRRVIANMSPATIDQYADSQAKQGIRAKRVKVAPTGVESPFADDEIIVSKTDLNGRITYTNDIFRRVSGFSRAELVGAPHSVIRHPAMPRAVFHLLWEELGRQREVFAPMINLCKNGDHYWVMAHVTPSFDRAGNVCGYHSNRRTIERRTVPTVQALYSLLCKTEQEVRTAGGSRHEAIAASRAQLARILGDKGKTFDSFVWSL